MEHVAAVGKALLDTHGQGASTLWVQIVQLVHTLEEMVWASHVASLGCTEAAGGARGDAWLTPR